MAQRKNYNFKIVIIILPKDALFAKPKNIERKNTGLGIVKIYVIDSSNYYLRLTKWYGVFAINRHYFYKSKNADDLYFSVSQTHALLLNWQNKYSALLPEMTSIDGHIWLFKR